MLNCPCWLSRGGLVGSGRVVCTFDNLLCGSSAVLHSLLKGKGGFPGFVRERKLSPQGVCLFPPRAPYFAAIGNRFLGVEGHVSGKVLWEPVRFFSSAGNHRVAVGFVTLYPGNQPQRFCGVEAYWLVTSPRALL